MSFPKKNSNKYDNQTKSKKPNSIVLCPSSIILEKCNATAIVLRPPFVVSSNVSPDPAINA